MKCDLGEVPYKGYCVPSYFTDEEKEEYVARMKEAEKKAKSNRATMMIVLIVLVVLSVAFMVINFMG